MLQLSNKTSDWTVSGVNDEIVSKMVKLTASNGDDTSQSSEKYLGSTVVGVDDELLSKTLEGTALSVEDRSQSADNRVGCWGISWMRIRCT